MLLEIEGRKFEELSNEKGNIIIPLNNKSDLLFFEDWKSDMEINERKIYYIKNNIYFETIVERGHLFGCFIHFTKFKESVILTYDYYKV